MELETRSLMIQYFRYLQQRNFPKLLLLFDDKPIIYEPISKHGIINDKSGIEMFLKYIAGTDAKLLYTINSVSPPKSRETGPVGRATLWVEGYRSMPYYHTFSLNRLEGIDLFGNGAIKRLDVTLEAES